MKQKADALKIRPEAALPLPGFPRASLMKYRPLARHELRVQIWFFALFCLFAGAAGILFSQSLAGHVRSYLSGNYPVLHYPFSILYAPTHSAFEMRLLTPVLAAVALMALCTQHLLAAPRNARFLESLPYSRGARQNLSLSIGMAALTLPILALAGYMAYTWHANREMLTLMALSSPFPLLPEALSLSLPMYALFKAWMLAILCYLFCSLCVQLFGNPLLSAGFVWGTAATGMTWVYGIHRFLRSWSQLSHPTLANSLQSNAAEGFRRFCLSLMRPFDGTYPETGLVFSFETLLLFWALALPLCALLLCLLKAACRRQHTEKSGNFFRLGASEYALTGLVTALMLAIPLHHGLLHRYRGERLSVFDPTPLTREVVQVNPLLPLLFVPALLALAFPFTRRALRAMRLKRAGAAGLALAVMATLFAPLTGAHAQPALLDIRPAQQTRQEGHLEKFEAAGTFGVLDTARVIPDPEAALPAQQLSPHLLTLLAQSYANLPAPPEASEDESWYAYQRMAEQAEEMLPILTGEDPEAYWLDAYSFEEEFELLGGFYAESPSYHTFQGLAQAPRVSQRLYDSVLYGEERGFFISFRSDGESREKFSAALLEAGFPRQAESVLAHTLGSRLTYEKGFWMNHQIHDVYAHDTEAPAYQSHRIQLTYAVPVTISETRALWRAVEQGGHLRKAIAYSNGQMDTVGYRICLVSEENPAQQSVTPLPDSGGYLRFILKEGKLAHLLLYARPDIPEPIYGQLSASLKVALFEGGLSEEDASRLSGEVIQRMQEGKGGRGQAGQAKYTLSSGKGENILKMDIEASAPQIKATAQVFQPHENVLQYP